MKNIVQSPSQPNQQQLMQALQAAYQFHAAGNKDQSRQVCDEILKVVPKQADAIHLLGVIALQDGNVEQAIHYFERAIKQNGRNPQFYCNLAFALHEQGQLKRAGVNYRKSIELDARFADAYFNLHALLIQANDFQPALECLTQVLTLNPGDNEAKFMQAVLLHYSGDYARAASLFDALKNIDTLLDARLDAWIYFSQLEKHPTLSGSNLDTFKFAMAAAKVKGLVLEFGVRHGNSIKQLVQLAGGQEVHGFDSFQGLPEAWHDESSGSYSTRGVLPKVPPLVKLHAGWFEQTLPVFASRHPEPIRLINVDCDIYSSTRTVLTTLAKQIVAGTVIIFDEYIGNEHWRQDEYKAFQEAVSEYGWTYEYLSVSFFTKQVVIRILAVKATPSDKD